MSAFDKIAAGLRDAIRWTRNREAFRADCGELSDEYLDALQRKIDAELGPREFRSISKAGW